MLLAAFFAWRSWKGGPIVSERVLCYNARMRQAVVIKLEPNPRQREALLTTMEAFNRACQYVADVAYERRVANKIALQPIVYGELRSRYLLRWGLFGGGWFVQAILVLAIGAAALRLQPWLAESLYFLVLWAVVVPLFAAVALSGSLFAVGAALWRRYIGAERRA